MQVFALLHTSGYIAIRSYFRTHMRPVLNPMFITLYPSENFQEKKELSPYVHSSLLLFVIKRRSRRHVLAFSVKPRGRRLLTIALTISFSLRVWNPSSSKCKFKSWYVTHRFIRMLIKICKNLNTLHFWWIQYCIHYRPIVNMCREPTV